MGDPMKKRKRVEMYADIGWGYTPAMMSEELKKDADDIDLHINSPGGSITDGIAIFNQIRTAVAGGREVVAHIDGIAASMASVIACAASKIVMYRNSYLMIHNPWTMTVGDADQLRHDADLLDSFKDRMIESYQSKFGLSKEEIDTLLDNETWISGADAGQYKLAAEIIDEEVKAAAIVGRMKLEMPDGAKPFYRAEESAVEPVSETAGTDAGQTVVADPVATEPSPEAGEPVVPEAQSDAASKLNQSALQIADMRKAYEETVKDYSAKIEAMTTAHTAELDSLKSVHAAEIKHRDDLIRQHQSEADRANASLKKRTEEAEQLRAKLSELIGPAVSFTPEPKPVCTWKEALAACGGDYVAARKQYHDVWAKTVKKSTK